MLLDLVEQFHATRTRTRAGRRNTMLKHSMDFHSRLAHRLSRLGIEIEFVANYPWIYLSKINGHVVTEKRQSEYGFTISLVSVKKNGTLQVLNLRETFQVIRKYAQLGRLSK